MQGLNRTTVIIRDHCSPNLSQLSRIKDCAAEYVTGTNRTKSVEKFYGRKLNIAIISLTFQGHVDCFLVTNASTNIGRTGSEKWKTIMERYSVCIIILYCSDCR